MHRTALRVTAAIGALLLTLFALSACDDPVPGPIGGLVLVIRSFEATKVPEIKAIKSIEIRTKRVEVQHSATADGEARFLTVDTQPRSIVIENQGQTDLLVAQYQVSVGLVSQIRIFPSAVTIHLKNGDDIVLDAPSSNLPSWEQSGWKLEPIEGRWPIQLDELTGVRILFKFDERLIYNKGNGYKISLQLLLSCSP